MEIGVFIPIGNNGWLLSENAPQYKPSFELNKQITLAADFDNDPEVREVGGLRAIPYRIPRGCIAAYYPECNPLIPVAHHAIDSHVPAAKSVPVRVVRGGHAPVPAGPAPE